MRRYEKISGLVFSLLTAVQLLRVLFRWPVQVGSLSVPLWASGLAILILGALAIWAFWTASTSSQS
jgi:hypothetical protein